MGPLACRNAQCSEPAARTVRETYRALMTNRRDTLSKSETVTIAAIEQGIPLLVEAREIIAGFHAIERIYLRDSSHGNHGRRLLHRHASTGHVQVRGCHGHGRLRRPHRDCDKHLMQNFRKPSLIERPPRVGHNRTKPAAECYRRFVAALEERRRELGLPMAQVDDLAGLQDGFFPKLIFPDAPNGRQSRWETVDLVVQALFGTGYRIKIEAGPKFCAPAKRDARGVAFVQVTHWRHKKYSPSSADAVPRRSTVCRASSGPPSRRRRRRRDAKSDLLERRIWRHGRHLPRAQRAISRSKRVDLKNARPLSLMTKSNRPSRQGCSRALFQSTRRVATQLHMILECFIEPPSAVASFGPNHGSEQ